MQTEREVKPGCVWFVATVDNVIFLAMTASLSRGRSESDKVGSGGGVSVRLVRDIYKYYSTIFAINTPTHTVVGSL